MSWEALGAIAETIGAIGVIATLAYLAIQIAQNTRAIRARNDGAHLRIPPQARTQELGGGSQRGQIPRRRGLVTTALRPSFAPQA